MTENQPARRDEGFANLVAVANVADSEYRYGVTLVVGGAVISGYMVPGRVFVDWASEKDPFFGPMKETYAKLEDAELTGEMIDETTFLYLADATIYTGNATLQVGFWRGLIDRVDGWSVGALKPVPKPS
jgi:hypothetical protein